MSADRDALFFFEEIDREEGLKCPFCGEPIKQDYNNCPYCGASLPRCPKCNKLISINFNVCPYCGTRLAEDKSKKQLPTYTLYLPWLFLLFIGFILNLFNNPFYILIIFAYSPIAAVLLIADLVNKLKNLAKSPANKTKSPQSKNKT